MPYRNPQIHRPTTGVLQERQDYIGRPWNAEQSPLECRKASEKSAPYLPRREDVSPLSNLCIIPRPQNAGQHTQRPQARSRAAPECRTISVLYPVHQSRIAPATAYRVRGEHGEFVGHPNDQRSGERASLFESSRGKCLTRENKRPASLDAHAFRTPQGHSPRMASAVA